MPKITTSELTRQSKSARVTRLRSGPEASYSLVGQDLDLFSEAGFDMCVPLAYVARTH